MRQRPYREFLTGPYVDVAVADLFSGGFQVVEVHVFHDVDAGVGHLLAPQELPERFSRSPQRNGRRLDSVSGEHGDDRLLGCRAVYVVYGAQVHVPADGGPVVLDQTAGQVYLAYHGRKHVGVFQVEVVVRAVEVGRHDGDIVRAVLQVEALAHLQTGDLGDGIGLVGVLQGSRKERLLLHGLRNVARIDAGASQEEELLDPVSEALADHVLLYLQVAVDEVGPIGVVGHDASHVGCGKKDVLGALLVEEPADGERVQKIQFAVAAAYQLRIPFAPQVVPYGRADESPVAGDVDASILFHVNTFSDCADAVVLRNPYRVSP